jgi:hypothetical protein
MGESPCGSLWGKLLEDSLNQPLSARVAAPLHFEKGDGKGFPYSSTRGGQRQQRGCGDGATVRVHSQAQPYSKVDGAFGAVLTDCDKGAIDFG